MATAARTVSTALAGLVIGAILWAAQTCAPTLFPWVVGFMLACIAANLRNVLE